MIFCCIVTECGHVTRGRSRVSNPMSCSHWTDWCSAASLALICGCVNSAQTGSTGPETRERSLQNKTQARLVFTWRLLKINSKSLKTEKQADQIVWTFMLYQSVMFPVYLSCVLVTEDWCSYDVVFLSFSVAEMCWRQKILEILSINDVVWNRNEDKSIKDSVQLQKKTCWQSTSSWDFHICSCQRLRITSTSVKHVNTSTCLRCNVCVSTFVSVTSLDSFKENMRQCSADIFKSPAVTNPDVCNKNTKLCVHKQTVLHKWNLHQQHLLQRFVCTFIFIIK